MTKETQRKTSFKLCISVVLLYFLIIPTRLTCLMWPNFPGTEFVEVALMFSKKTKNSPSSVPVLQKALKLSFNVVFLAEGGKEMYQNCNARAET